MFLDFVRLTICVYVRPMRVHCTCGGPNGIELGRHSRSCYRSMQLPEQLTDMRDLIKRDRSHASVMAWSFCNEGECSATQCDSVRL